MFKRKKKKTGYETPKYTPPTMPPIEPAKEHQDYSIKILIKRDTTQNYVAINPILRLKELAVEYNENGIVGYKIGDGLTPWSELSYITNLTDIKEFYLWANTFDGNNRKIYAKIVIDPFVINDFLGGTKCKEQTL